MQASHVAKAVVLCAGEWAFFVRKCFTVGESVIQALRDCVYGQAVADALGVPYEFRRRGTFRCTDMVGRGGHNQPAGTWSDDASMALAICDSYRELGRIDVDDIRGRFVRWYREGAYTADGLFDIGNATLMRTVPLAFTDATDDEVRAVSAITHAHPTSTEACVAMVHIARDLIAGASPADVAGDVAARPVDEIRSGGFVRHTFDAALWCLANTSSYAECALAAVNLGDDTDTTAAVAGALAGIVYGIEGIPAEWLDKLRGTDVIESCLF